MAGSYKHCLHIDGTFREHQDFRDMIENLGDAEEACEQMVFMIQWLARQIVLYSSSPPDPNETVYNEINRVIEESQQAFYDRDK